MKQIQTQKQSLKEHRKTDQNIDSKYGWLKGKHVVRKLCNVRARGNWEQKLTQQTIKKHEPKKWSENSYVCFVKTLLKTWNGTWRSEVVVEWN